MSRGCAGQGSEGGSSCLSPKHRLGCTIRNLSSAHLPGLCSHMLVYSSLPSLVASCPYPCLWPLKGDKARAGVLWRLSRFRDTCFRNLSESKDSSKSQVDFEKQEISLAYTWLPWCCLFFTALEREAGAREAAAEGPHDRRVHTTRLQSPSCPWSSPAVCHHRGYRPSDTPPLNLAGTERDSWGCCGAKPTGLLSTRFPQGRLGMILV